MRVWMRVGWCGGGQPVGETQQRPFQLSFNSSLRVDFQGARVTSDGRLVLVRELDERLRLSELVDRHLSDSRRGKNIQLPLAGRESLRRSQPVSVEMKGMNTPKVNWMPYAMHRIVNAHATTTQP